MPTDSISLTGHACGKLRSVILAFLIFSSVGARGAAAAGDEDGGGTAIFSEPQGREKQSKELLLKSEISPGHQPKFRDTDDKRNEASELQGSTSLVQAVREEIKSAKRLATFARLNKRPRLLRELQSRIREMEQVVGGTVVDADLPRSTPEKRRALRRVLSRATERHNRCEDTARRLESLVVLNENKVLGLKEENKFLSRLAARTMPKGLHCLALQLTIKYYHQLREGSVIADEKKLNDGGLFHYVLYTENILAATAIVKSTLHFAKEPHRHIFHVLTDGLNHAAMQMWFWINAPYKGVVEVKNLDSLSGLHVSQARKYLKPVMPRALRLEQGENLETIKRIRLYYNLPEVFFKLDKIIVLDDDIVVRKDLTHLWEEDLHHKVIGAVRSNSKREAMPDWSCINIVDLGEWRRQGLSHIYKQSILTLEEDMGDEITSFHDNAAYMLHDSPYYVVDLDDTQSELDNDMQNAAAIHYRGYAKPWLGMGMSRHGSLWSRFVDYEDPLLQACNVNK